jgi:hypothetical protein
MYEGMAIIIPIMPPIIPDEIIIINISRGCALIALE